MSKPFMISVALSALIVTAAPAMAQRHPGPSNLRDADHSPPTTAITIAVPALIRARAQPDPVPAPGDDSASAPHVKVFDGKTLTAGEPQPQAAAKPILSVRKAGEPPEAAPQPEGEESAAARMQTQNNLKQISLGAH